MDNISADPVSSVKLGKVLKVCAGLLVILVLLALAGVVVAGFLVPRRYYSQVTMELPQEARGPVPVFGPGSPPWSFDPQYVQAQLAMLQGKKRNHGLLG